MFNAMRSFFNDRGYLENTCFTADSWWCCSTPIYHTTTRLTCLYMRIANELYLKRLIVGGFEGFMSFLKFP
jgi:lysyl-tRNA synthetase class 2